MAQMQIFQLIDTLEPGKQAKATLLKWSNNTYTSRGGQAVIVYSYAGSHGIPGDRGYCILGDSGRWEVVGSLVNEQMIGG